MIDFKACVVQRRVPNGELQGTNELEGWYRQDCALAVLVRSHTHPIHGKART